MSAVIKCKTRLKNQGDLVTALKKIGVGELFTPGASTVEIIEYVNSWAGQHQQ